MLVATTSNPPRSIPTSRAAQYPSLGRWAHNPIRPCDVATQIDAPLSGQPSTDTRRIHVASRITSDRFEWEHFTAAAAKRTMVVDYFLDKKQSEWQEKRGVVVWVMSSPIAVSSKLRKREIGANYKINKNGRGRGESSERRGGVRRLRRLVSLFCSASPYRILRNVHYQTVRSKPPANRPPIHHHLSQSAQ